MCITLAACGSNTKSLVNTDYLLGTWETSNAYENKDTWEFYLAENKVIDWNEIEWIGDEWNDDEKNAAENIANTDEYFIKAKLQTGSTSKDGGTTWEANYTESIRPFIINQSTLTVEYTYRIDSLQNLWEYTFYTVTYTYTVVKIDENTMQLTLIQLSYGGNPVFFEQSVSIFKRI